MRRQLNKGVHLHAGARGGALLDLGSGAWYWLDPIGAEAAAALADGVEPNEVAAALAHTYRVPVERVSADVDALVTRFDALGVLAGIDDDATPRPRTAFAPMNPTPGPAPGRVRPPSRVVTSAALLALYAAGALVHGAATRRTVALLTLLHRLPARRATVEQAERMHAAVTRAARWYPGRAACLETSIAVALLAAALGRRVSFCLGVRYDPHEHHAWIAIGNQPIGEPGERASLLHPAFVI